MSEKEKFDSPLKLFYYSFIKKIVCANRRRVNVLYKQLQRSVISTKIAG